MGDLSTPGTRTLTRYYLNAIHQINTKPRFVSITKILHPIQPKYLDTQPQTIILTFT